MSKILIVDDDDLFLMLYKNVFEQDYYDVVTASTTSLAMQYINSNHHFDIIITDIIMLDGTGLEVIVHAQRERPYVPVIAMSSEPRNLKYAR